MYAFTLTIHLQYLCFFEFLMDVDVDNVQHCKLINCYRVECYLRVIITVI